MAREVGTGEKREESADVTMKGVVLAGGVEVELAGAGAEAQPRTTRLTYQSSSVS